MAGKEEGQRSEVSSTSSSSSQGDGSSVCLAPPSWNRLIPLRSRDDTRRFLRAILNNFVDTVDLEKPGLLEDLMAVRVLTERDAESLAAEHLYPTTSEKARHLWSILFRINFKVFVEKALPILVQHYWYIIPERFWLPGDAPPSQHTLGAGSSHSSGDTPPCLRCAIQRRIRPTDLADLLMAAGLINSKTYMEVIQGYRKSSTDWAKLFAALKHPKCRDMPSLVSKLQRMVTRHSLPVSDDFPHLLTQGFPCSCPVNKNKTGLCFPCASNLSSSDSSLPSLHSLPVSSVSENCQYVSSVSEDYQYPSLLSLLSASSDDRDTYRNRWNEYDETTLKQVVSISTQNIPLDYDIFERRLETNEETSQCDDEKHDMKATGLDFIQEGEVTSHCSQDEEETQLKSLLVEEGNREMSETLPKLVVWRENVRPLPLQIGQHVLLDTSAAEREQSHIADESNTEETRNWSHQTSAPETQIVTDSQPVFPIPSKSDSNKPETLLNETMKSEQTEAVINIDKDAENRDTQKSCIETELSDIKHQSFETLIRSGVSDGLCSRLGSCTSRLCGRYTKCGMCLSDTGACLKTFLLMLGVFCGGLILLALIVLPYVLIIITAVTENYNFGIAGVFFLGLQAAFFGGSKTKGGMDTLFLRG